jgi:hypothetical protein
LRIAFLNQVSPKRYNDEVNIEEGKKELSQKLSKDFKKAYS